MRAGPTNRNTWRSDVIRKLNYSIEEVVELSLKHQELISKVNELYSVVDAERRRAIRLQVATAFTMSQITSSSELISDIRHSLVNEKKVDINALGKLLNTDKFELIDKSTIRMVSMQRDYYTTEIFFRFYASTFNPALKVLKVEAFDHWVNVTDSPTLVRYDGDP